MKKEPLLSVIVPVYNAAAYLQKCVDSIRSQTYRNLEIVLVDDGSADNSAEICEEYAGRDARIKLLRRPHEGLVATRKAGVAFASGAYVAYVDSDDWLEPEAYEKLIAFMGESAPDVLIHGFKEERWNKAFVCRCCLPAGCYDAAGISREIYPHLLARRHVEQPEVFSGSEADAAARGEGGFRRVRQPFIYACLWSKIVKRDLLLTQWEKVPSDVSIGEDFICTVYTLFSARSVMVTDYAPYHYQIREDSVSIGNTSFQPYQALFGAAYAALENSPMRETHIAQLYELFLENILLTRYETFLQGEFSDLPFGKLENCRVALYGAGRFGQEIYRKTNAAFPGRITLWVDRNYEAYRNSRLPVEPVGELLTREYDVIVIALVDEVICEEIRQSLAAMGIAPEKVRYAVPTPELLEAVKKTLENRSGFQ